MLRKRLSSVPVACLARYIEKCGNDAICFPLQPPASIVTMNSVSKTTFPHTFYPQNGTLRRGGGLPTRDTILKLSLALNAILSLSLLYWFVWALSLAPNKPYYEAEHQTFKSSSSNNAAGLHGYDRTWHGGHPLEDRAGSCWCGAQDQYCMCTPNLSIDLIVTSRYGNDIWLVRRRDTNQLATMGGFVDVDETVENAIFRELMEEMGIDLTKSTSSTHNVVLMGIYSDPRRDNRRRTASAVYAVQFDESKHHPTAGDDAKEVKRISVNDIEEYEYFADHRTILLDYRRWLRGEPFVSSTVGDFAPDIVRSTCSAATTMRDNFSIH